MGVRVHIIVRSEEFEGIDLFRGPYYSAVEARAAAQLLTDKEDTDLHTWTVYRVERDRDAVEVGSYRHDGTMDWSEAEQEDEKRFPRPRPVPTPIYPPSTQQAIDAIRGVSP